MLKGLALVIALAAFTLTAPATAALAAQGDWVREDAHRVVGMALEECRKDPGRFLHTLVVMGPLSDPWVLRAACGAGMDRRRLMDTDFRMYYHRDASEQGFFEVFGAAKEVPFADRTYRVIIGETIRAATRHGKVTSKEVVPAAYVMERQEGDAQWRRVWSYFDPLDKKVLLSRGEFENDPTAPPGAGDFLRRLWNQEVNKAFHDIVFRMRDSRGVTLFR